MTRSAGEQLEVKPGNNVYTVLVIVAVVVEVIGLLALFMRANDIFQGKGLM